MKPQCQQILKHMQEHQSITQLEAIEKYRILRLAARISDLKADGYRIVSIPVTDKKPDGSYKRYSRYYLTEGK